MENKILELLENAKSMEGNTLPIEKEAIVKLLEAVPYGIRFEYAEAMISFANDFLLLRNIFTLDQGSLSFKHLIENLSPMQVQHLATIARIMESDDRNTKAVEIVKHSFGFTTHTIECDNIVK